MTVPTLPDTERRTRYVISVASTGPYNVGFDLYGDSTDYGQWIEVYDDGVKLAAATDWTLDSPTGALASIARPITNARITFTVARSGNIDIVGAQRPRRPTQLTEGTGETAASRNRTYTELKAMLRERWDLSSRLTIYEPGVSGALPPISGRVGKFLSWDSSGAPLVANGIPNIASSVTWVDVKANFGAVGNGSTDDTAAFNSAIAALPAGGLLYAPPGTYKLSSGITLGDGIRLVGAGRNCTILTSANTDINVVTLSGVNSGLEHVWILGKGAGGDTGTFGATQNTLVVSGNFVVVRDVIVWGGSLAMRVSGNDGIIEDVYCNAAYGAALAATVSSNWYKRCKFDHATTSVTITSTQPYGARANTTVYTAGQVKTLSSYAIECITGGTSGGSPPALKNYGQNITDGTVVWQLLAPASFTGFLVTTGALENRFEQCDFSGNGFTNSVSCDEATAALQFNQCVFSSGATLSAGTWVEVSSTALGGNISIGAAFAGKTHIHHNRAFGVIAVAVAANVNSFIIKDNFLPGGSITTSGTSDHYVISGNVGATVTDGGTGVNKSVTGNVA